MKPLKIFYLVEDTHLSGGMRVVLAQADALTARGHEVTIVAKGDRPTWRHSNAHWVSVASFDDVADAAFDFIVGTFWTTLPIVHRLAPQRGIHLCQGYEGAFTAYREIKPEIDAAYRLPIPKITVSQHLVAICQQFNRDSTYIGQIVDDIFFREPALRETNRPRILVSGQAQADMKGIAVAYEAVRLARRSAELDLVRVTSWAPAEDEPLDLASEFHVGLDTAAMAELLGSCHMFLGTNLRVEGFGLPAAEAMASGLAAVLSAIPSFLSFDNTQQCAMFVPENDAAATAAALRALIEDPPLRRRLALRGRDVSEQFRSYHVGIRLERYFLERLTR